METPRCAKCGKKHEEKCLAGMDVGKVDINLNIVQPVRPREKKVTKLLLLVPIPMHPRKKLL